MRNKVSYSDIYDINKKTGALILGANRLDDYATKFLNKYCSEALVNPMPNLYFTRDPFATIGNAVSLNHMYSDTRNRETLYGKYIFKHHPVYGGNVELVYNREETTRIEGGDELVLSKDVLAVGISQRTDAASIEKLLVNIFKKNVGFKKVIAFEFANNRKFMHLDTVFTMVDYDKFTIHPEIEGDLRVYSVTYENEKIYLCACSASHVRFSAICSGEYNGYQLL